MVNFSIICSSKVCPESGSGFTTKPGYFSPPYAHSMDLILQFISKGVRWGEEEGVTNLLVRNINLAEVFLPSQRNFSCKDDVYCLGEI
jgi:hypothetical protein